MQRLLPNTPQQVEIVSGVIKCLSLLKIYLGEEKKTFPLQGQGLYRGRDRERYDQDRQQDDRYGDRGYQEDRYGEDRYGQDRHDGHEDDDDGEYEVPVSEDNLQVKGSQNLEF